MRILAVAAHPDDLEQLCGGTLARFTAEGHEVTMCHVSTGDCGSFVHTKEEISLIRDGEAAKAAAVLGARHVSLRLSDGDVNSADPRQKNLAIDLVRSVRPDILITHHPADYMPDHVETGRLFEDASFVATLPNYQTTSEEAGFVREEAHLGVPAVYYMDTLAGLGFLPTEYVDISPVIEIKIAALAEHASQVEWLRDHDSIDVLQRTRTVNAFRGFQAGTEFAEGFIASLKWLRPRTKRLLP